MTAPLISVALPVRNGANYLAAALDSILVQSYADFELHISDNASDDDTPAILADFAARDPRVKVSRSGEVLGQVASMNRAVQLTDTPWVRMICHDDLMRADCMARTADAVAKVGERVVLIGNDERHLFANGYITPKRADAPLQVYRGAEVLRRRFAGGADALLLPSITTATVRKAAFDAQGGFDPRWVHFDIFCWSEMLVEGDYGFIPAQLTVNRIHGGQVAMAARSSLRSAIDHRGFVGQFIARHGEAIALDRRSRWRSKLIAPGYAASALVSALRAGNYAAGAQLMARIPFGWLPLLPALVPWAWRKEVRRLAELKGHVPLELLYPN
ncbi:MAG: glycosyltransferase [Pseudomonadota bacterium]|nr:glycosyltransferase [Pseudomonadota bacterium]